MSDFSRRDDEMWSLLKFLAFGFVGLFVVLPVVLAVTLVGVPIAIVLGLIALPVLGIMGALSVPVLIAGGLALVALLGLAALIAVAKVVFFGALPLVLVGYVVARLLGGGGVRARSE